jgi:anti-sigma regulatory factor (Ser/Thr protein kinase)
MCKKAETTVSCAPESVAWARHWALSELTSMYANLGSVSSDIQVVVSELVTNAVLAGCSRLLLVIDGHHSFVRIATEDDAPGFPVKQEPTSDRTHGRGLLVTDALSSRWGVDPDGGGKTVWADVPLPGELEPTFDCAR